MEATNLAAQSGRAAEATAPFGSIIAVWKSIQLAFPQVVRWGIFARTGIREQNDLQHVASVTWLARHFCLLCRQLAYPRYILDETLVLGAFIIHEDGERLRQRDVCFPHKSDEKDLEEYLAAVEEWKAFPATVQNNYKREFLLQFAHRIPECFPADARRIMEELWETRRNEVLAFRSIEVWDYLLYAIEHVQQDNGEIRKVFRDLFEICEDLAKEFPLFAKIVWTPENRAWFQERAAECPPGPQA